MEQNILQRGETLYLALFSLILALFGSFLTLFHAKSPFLGKTGEQKAHGVTRPPTWEKILNIIKRCENNSHIVTVSSESSFSISFSFLLVKDLKNRSKKNK